MKIAINRDFSYSDNNISELSGWKVWYDWQTVKKHIRIIYVCITVLIVLASFTFKKLLISDGILHLAISVLFALFIWLFIVTPIHEILHLIPLAGLKLNNKCVLP